MKIFKSTLAATAIGLLATGPAMAHHAMGGQMPQTFAHGLLSGLGHPVIGVDHLAFILAVGLAAAFTPRRFLTPLAFIAATLAGCAMQIAGIGLPLAEVAIAASVVLLGGMLLSGRRFATGVYLSVFAVAGLFHGWAYGQSIVGAESTPLAAYLIGFAVMQYAIAQGAAWVTLNLWKARDASAVKPRLAGALAAGFGVAFLIENVESLLVV